MRGGPGGRATRGGTVARAPTSRGPSGLPGSRRVAGRQESRDRVAGPDPAGDEHARTDAAPPGAVLIETISPIIAQRSPRYARRTASFCLRSADTPDSTMVPVSST
jgi:hypothetical protein